MQERANAAGFDGIPVSGHLLRAGHATTAAVNGALSTGSPPRPDAPNLGTLLTTTSAPLRRWRPPTAATSACSDQNGAEAAATPGVVVMRELPLIMSMRFLGPRVGPRDSDGWLRYFGVLTNTWSGPVGTTGLVATGIA